MKTYQMQQSSIIRLYSEQDRIQFDPTYQRNGDVWSLEKRQLLIDSIINNYDLPKLYFHDLSDGRAAHAKFDFAIVDGRQRLETIFKFVDDGFKLSDDFVYFDDPSVEIAGKKYSEIASENSKIRIRFDSYNLPIVIVETDEIDQIEDMFSRLNEAASLNAAEKRNAFGGNVVTAINEISDTVFFRRKVKFSNKRYQHKEVSARILYILHSIKERGKIYDTKKTNLDNFTKKNKYEDIDPYKDAVLSTLERMSLSFVDNDSLLAAQASVPIYFLLFIFAEQEHRLPIRREELTSFRDNLVQNRKFAEQDISEANYELLEYDRLSQQGTNDASSIVKRLSILAEHLNIHLEYEKVL